MINYIIKRLNISPYQNPEYNYWEKEMILGLNLTYFSQDENLDSLPDWDNDRLILISNTHTDWNQIAQKTLEQTDLIIHPNSGYDNFSLDFLRQYEIPVLLGNPIRAHGVANYILNALYSHINELPKRHSWDNTRSWNRQLLKDKQVLLIGHGHIGKILEKALTPVAGKVHIYDPYENRNLDLLKTAANCEVIIPVAGLNQTSKHIINQTFLDILPDNFLIINGARGELIDTNALFSKLKSKKESFAYLDVFEKEPFNFRTIDHLPNICLSSHIAGCYNSLDQEMIEFIKNGLKDYLNLNSEKFNQKYDSLLLQNRIRDNLLI